MLLNSLVWSSPKVLLGTRRPFLNKWQVLHPSYPHLPGKIMDQMMRARNYIGLHSVREGRPSKANRSRYFVYQSELKNKIPRSSWKSFPFTPPSLSSLTPPKHAPIVRHVHNKARPIKVSHYTSTSAAPSPLKKLPVGLQSFREIVNGGYIYVDKTELALQLIQEKKYCFISRPRRFGKSLFVNMLRSLFLGEKDVFKGCFVYNSHHHWEKHPVIHIDFSQIKTNNLENLENSLRNKLAKIRLSYDKTNAMANLPIYSAQDEFINLIEFLSRENKVVVLIDEYDKPLLDNLQYLETAEKIRDYLKNFYEVLKSLDENLRFVFITGVSKFSQVALFSGLNNLTDMTMNPKYAQLMGYTEQEITHYFRQHIKEIVKNRRKLQKGVSEKQILEEIRLCYNGYRFSSEQKTVYNPHSTLCYMEQGVAESYWYQTGTPSFLVKHLKEKPIDLLSLSGLKVEKSRLLNFSRLDMADIAPLMFQTGYLTIQDYDSKNELYTLDFPNREVREAFFQSIFHELIPPGPAISFESIRKDLISHDLESFFNKINTCFAKIPYYLFKDGEEKFYHAILLTLLENFKVKTRAEEATNVGRIDLSFEVFNTVYIIECKLNQSSEIALKQAETTKYKEKYSCDGKSILLLGINFSSKTRNVEAWKGKVFSSSGVLTKEIGSQSKQN